MIKLLDVSTMNNLDTVFVRNKITMNPKSWFQWGIRKATKSDWDHVGAYLELFGESFILESTLLHGVRLTSVKHYNTRVKLSEYEVIPNLSTKQEKAAKLRKAFSKLGYSKYDIRAYLPHMWKLITKKWTGKKGNSAAEKFVCSEFIGYMEGIEGWEELTPQGLNVELKRLLSEK